MQVTYLGTGRTGKLNIIIKYPLIFGLPRYYTAPVGKRGVKVELDSDDAAEISYQAVMTAMRSVVDYVADNESMSRDDIKSRWIKEMSLRMNHVFGKVDRSGSGSPKIIVNEADYGWW